MKKLRIIAAFLLLLILTAVTACNPLADDEEEGEQYVEVEKGDLFVAVSGSGNIETSEDANLSFGAGGRIDRIYIEEGDRVTKGDILAELDTDSLELAMDQAQYALTQAEVALIQAELSQKTAEYNLDNVLDQQDALELALFKAQIDVRSAEHHVDETQDIYTWPEIEVAKDDVEDAKAFLDYLLSFGPTQEQLDYAQSRLDAAESTLDAMITTYDTEEVAIAKLQLEAAEMAEAQARKNLDEMNEDTAIKELQIEAAKARPDRGSHHRLVRWHSGQRYCGRRRYDTITIGVAQTDYKPD
jgi:multidrug efflux pump subunit AcrA (membrane-fusion protein)